LTRPFENKKIEKMKDVCNRSVDLIAEFKKGMSRLIAEVASIEENDPDAMASILKLSRECDRGWRDQKLNTLFQTMNDLKDICSAHSKNTFNSNLFDEFQRGGREIDNIHENNSNKLQISGLTTQLVCNILI